MVSSTQPKSLIFDLEVVPGKADQPDRIFMVGAMRPDTGEELELKVERDLPVALDALEHLGQGASFVLGHNVINHDLPILQDQAPHLALHQLPVIDTLRLSPLAFPQNPYHRLVKDYKLIRDSLNSPLSDCHSTLTLFNDQRQAFVDLNVSHQAELLCYQALLAPSLKSDLGALFASIAGQAPKRLTELRSLIPELLRETDPTLTRTLKVCSTRLDQLLEIDLMDETLHWPLAYVLAWLRVSGGNSVLAPWVRHQFPEVGRLITELRDTPCGQSNCGYCSTTHDPRHELRRYFAPIEDFRIEPDGRTLQHDVVLAGMQGKHVLAILATGGGKSLCYQLPALNRFHRNGSLTVIISPLQSLMKDQVDGLLARNVQCAATLTLRDIQQILRKLRKESDRRKGGRLVITAGEVLMDEQVETSFEAGERDAETKVVTAVAWLERGQFLKREENQTQIFPASLKLPKEEADKRLAAAKLPARRLEEFKAILSYLYDASADERINTDALMALTSLTSEEVTATLRQMEDLGVLVNDSKLTLYVRHGVVFPSTQRLQATLELESALFDLLQELAPEAEGGEWQDLNVPLLTSVLKTAIGNKDLIPLHVLRLLRSLAQDHDSETQLRSSFELRQISQDYLKLRIRGRYNWRGIQGLGERRRALAAVVLPFLIGKLPPGSRNKDLLVDTTFGELMNLIDQDLELRVRIPESQRRKAIEHVLLYLHKQDVLTLNHGMTVMRRAMTIEVDPEKRTGYLKDDYQRLDEHYREKRIQVHVMREYAEVALGSMREARDLVKHYFTLAKQEFIRRYFAGREEVLKLATSEESWRSIVEKLSAAQRVIVSDDDDVNRLVLAGPGSGKTRVIVHRIAYLLRVRRVPSRCIVALTFNRHAANEIKQRLLKLVGPDAFGVNVMTYHRMAMRLTGTRFERGETVEEGRLAQVMAEAVELLEGKRQVEGEDDLREQLMRGYRYILVDEYQDIDDLQYRLVSALAGRKAEEEGRLCILAVGDDDQNIYAWRDTNNQYIERFREDYSAATSFLVDNYRSSARIIEAANSVISRNPERLKQDHPIQIDTARRERPQGGDWEALDLERVGRVLRLRIDAEEGRQANLQAQAAMAELQRLLSLDSEDWQGCAVLARTHQYLLPVQAWCEAHGVPYCLAADKGGALPLTAQRGFVQAVEELREITEPLSATAAWTYLSDRQFAPDWYGFFVTAFEQLMAEFGQCPLSPQTLIDWLYDYVRELRQQPRQGLYLGTVHSAKGLEFRHVVVLDGGWSTQPETLSDERRLYYVGMTRAEQTLTVCEFPGGNPFSRHLTEEIRGRIFQGEVLPELDKRYLQLSLADIDLDFAGRQALSAPIHEALAHLEPGDPLTLQAQDDRYLVLGANGQVVGRTAKSFKLELELEHCEVAAVLVRQTSQCEEQYRAWHKCDRWELVVPRIVGVSRLH